MMDSIIHAAVTASIFFGIRSLKPHLILFDTSVVDVTEYCSDPVETMMKVQLGGKLKVNIANTTTPVDLEQAQDVTLQTYDLDSKDLPAWVKEKRKKEEK